MGDPSLSHCKHRRENEIFNVSHVSWATLPGDSVSLPAQLDELPGAKDEHPDVAVVHDSGLSLSVLQRWRLFLEYLESDNDACLAETSQHDVVLQAMELVAQETSGLERMLHWETGYRPAAEQGRRHSVAGRVQWKLWCVPCNEESSRANSIGVSQPSLFAPFG